MMTLVIKVANTLDQLVKNNNYQPGAMRLSNYYN